MKNADWITILWAVYIMIMWTSFVFGSKTNLKWMGISWIISAAVMSKIALLNPTNELSMFLIMSSGLALAGFFILLEGCLLHPKEKVLKDEL